MSALEVLFADNHLLVVAKPAGVPTVPDDSRDESLLDQAKAWVKVEYQKPGAVFLGVVQRLDRPVSGVLVFARTSKAAARLTAAFGKRTAHKTYHALGVPGAGGGRMPAPGSAGELVQWLAKDREKNRVHTFGSEDAAPEGAKRAVTRWRCVGAAEWEGTPLARLELKPVTGRSHQLRLAARALGLPLLGDVKYGRGLAPLPDRSIGLHARALGVTHPTTRVEHTFTAAHPERAWWRVWSA